jgi:nucleotide-binding universal stress UspA family protein
MSAIKTILVPVDESTTAAVPLETAFRLADAFSCHVTVLHVRPDPTLAIPMVGEGMSGAMVEEMLGMAERQSGEQAAAVRAIYDATRLRHPLQEASAPPVAQASCCWVERTGRSEDLTAWHGRLHDLIVMPRPEPHAVDGSASLNAALMDSGRPLLLTPPAEVPAAPLNVAIAWNGSAEAARAVAHAAPLLAIAHTVTILTAAESDCDSAAGQELAQALAWHGIQAGTRSIPAGGHAGPALLAECRAVGANLLVMGAYTHSRLRQLILGGVTRHVLSHAELPVLLCH